MKRTYTQPSILVVRIKPQGQLMSTSTVSVSDVNFDPESMTDLVKSDNTPQNTSVWDDDWRGQ